jgi:hypothetical protein
LDFRETATEINTKICDALLDMANTTSATIKEQLCSISIDFLEDERLDPSETQPMFKQRTNLPHRLVLCVGARVMFLDNPLFNRGLCNGTVGIVTNIIDPNTIRVAFACHRSINDTQYAILLHQRR